MPGMSSLSTTLTRDILRSVLLVRIMSHQAYKLIGEFWLIHSHEVKEICYIVLNMMV